MDIIGFLKEWMWVLNLVPALVLFIGVPAFIVVRRRRLARMTEVERRRRLETDRRIADETIEEGKSWYWNPANSAGHYRRDD